MRWHCLTIFTSADPEGALFLPSADTLFAFKIKMTHRVLSSPNPDNTSQTYTQCSSAVWVPSLSERENIAATANKEVMGQSPPRQGLLNVFTTYTVYLVLFSAFLLHTDTVAELFLLVKGSAVLAFSTHPTPPTLFPGVYACVHAHVFACLF